MVLFTSLIVMILTTTHMNYQGKEGRMGGKGRMKTGKERRNKKRNKRQVVINSFMEKTGGAST